MHTHRTTYGELSCHVLSATAAPPERLVVLCHGYGAEAGDLTPLAGALDQLRTDGRPTRYIFFDAPLSLTSLGLATGRAWWHLDLATLQQRQGVRDAWLAQVRREPFEGVAQARRVLRRAVDQALQQAALPYSALILGGFSQGAMLTTDLALRLEEAPAGLAILSGTLTDEPTLQRLAARRAGLRVVQSHGEQDPILPFSNATPLRDLLEAAGCHVTFVSFPGGHTIPEQALRALAALCGVRP